MNNLKKINNKELQVIKYSWSIWKGKCQTGLDRHILKKFREEMDQDADIVFIQKNTEPIGIFRGKLNKPTRVDDMLTKNGAATLEFWSIEDMTKPKVKQKSAKELF